MAESRAVVAASLCYESFALVPAEAHALGTPVLASATRRRFSAEENYKTLLKLYGRRAAEEVS